MYCCPKSLFLDSLFLDEEWSHLEPDSKRLESLLRRADRRVFEVLNSDRFFTGLNPPLEECYQLLLSPDSFFAFDHVL